MSLALIQESAKEVRRLSIAGSPLSVGDFRLKKLIAPLEQAGAKVPVFAQVAKAVNDLVNGSDADSATNLLNLSTLINAILYTQGQTGTDGAYQDMEISPASSTTTRTTARVLKPLIEALTSTGSGRFQVVKGAFERGTFSDLRLIEPSIRALDDVYPELADLVTQKILPSYGPGIAPLLKENLNLKGKKSDARRLTVLHQLEPAKVLDLCKTALDEGAVDVKAAAIACLAKHEECLPLVLEQANSKNKVVRAAALEALAEHDRPEVTSLFTNLIKGKGLDILAAPFRQVRNREVLNSLLNEGKSAFELLLKGDQPQITRFEEILNCLIGRKDAQTEEFLLWCFNQCDKLLKLKSAIVGAILMEKLVSWLQRVGSDRAIKAVLDKRDILPPQCFSEVLRCALRSWSPAKVYQEFAPLLGQTKGGAKQKSEQIRVAIWSGQHADDPDFYAEEDIDPDTSDAQMLKKVEWDPRWLDAAIKADQLVIVACLAKPGHKAAIAYLLKQLEDKKQTQISLIFEALARCGHSDLCGVFIEQVAKKAKKAQYYDWELQQLFQSARYLPASDLPKLDALASKLDEKFVDKYLEALEPLRLAKQASGSSAAAPQP